MAKNKISNVKKQKSTPKRKSFKDKNVTKKQTKKEKPKKDYSDMTFGEFLNEEINDDGSSLSDNEDRSVSPDLNIDLNTVHKKIKENESDSDGSESENDEEENEFESHKESLAKLKEIDPEFYKFLEENDKKLLQFNDLDDEGSDSENDEDLVHKPSEELEVASDESDFEPDDDRVPKDNRVITLKLIKQWQIDLQTDKSAKTMNNLVKAFHAALLRVSTDDDVDSEYKVDGSAVFNAVVQLCVLEFGPALRRYLKISAKSKLPVQKSKKFAKIRSMLKSYFEDLVKLLSGVTSINILTVLLKHLHYMSPFLSAYSNVARKLLKKLINLWGTSQESVRVLAFMCIVRITNNNLQNYLDLVLKAMYMTYVKNSKFVSVTTLPEVNFMRRSLAEMFALDVNIAYQHVFLYIRQLAIHLRNAVTLQKKEHIQAVYNWQFINSIHLWANLLSLTCNKPQLQPLIYPLTQIAIGVIKLLPTAQYYPLRFHITHILIQLSKDSNIFIPILPFLLEVLSSFNFNKKHKKVSMKPLNFTCILRASKSQMQENGFKDAVVDSIFGLTLEYLANQSHSIAFPDISLFTILQIRQFLKKCNQMNYTKQMKQLLQKIEQTSKFVEDERKKVNFTISDLKSITAWESKMKNKNPPLAEFYENWKQTHNMKKRKLATNNEEIGEYHLPEIKKIKKNVTKKQGPVELFPSDSENDDENIGFTDQNEKEEKPKKVKKKRPKRTKKDENTTLDDLKTGETDIVQDLNLSDW